MTIDDLASNMRTDEWPTASVCEIEGCDFDSMHHVSRGLACIHLCGMHVNLLVVAQDALK